MNSTKRREIKTQAASLAERTRDNLRLTDLEPIRIHAAIRQLDILAFFRSMNDNLSGVAVKMKSSNEEEHRFMMINTSKALGHQRFTACHEFYHLLYQRDFSFVRDNTARFDEKDPEELMADWFASYLILPRNGLLRLVPIEEQFSKLISLSTLLKIEQNYRCSRKTLLFRLKDLGWINSEQFDQYSVDVMKNARCFGYPTDLYESSRKNEFIGDYNIKARCLYDEGKISQAQYYSLLEDIGIDLNTDLEDHGEV